MLPGWASSRSPSGKLSGPTGHCLWVPGGPEALIQAEERREGWNPGLPHPPRSWFWPPRSTSNPKTSDCYWTQGTDHCQLAAAVAFCLALQFSLL